MKFETYSYTNSGGRSLNEDASGYCIGNNRGLWVLCDGLGGHEHGEMASNTAVKEMLDSYASGKLTNHNDLKTIIEGTNKTILNLNGPLTTIVAAYYWERCLSIANVGDSRLYYFRNRHLFFVTDDHSIAFLDYRLNYINYTDIRFHSARSNLLKALGIQEEFGVQTYPLFEISPGDAFLLCSDGFWEYVFETEMEIDLLKSKTPESWIKHMLVRAAARIPADNDNMTALAVFIQNDSQEVL